MLRTGHAESLATVGEGRDDLDLHIPGDSFSHGSSHLTKSGEEVVSCARGGMNTSCRGRD